VTKLDDPPKYNFFGIIKDYKLRVSLGRYINSKFLRFDFGRKLYLMAIHLSPCLFSVYVACPNNHPVCWPPCLYLPLQHYFLFYLFGSGPLFSVSFLKKLTPGPLVIHRTLLPSDRLSSFLLFFQYPPFFHVLI
jgi:hypothetical protein